MVQFPGSWAIDEMDCEEVLVRRRDNRALATIHVIHDGKGNIGATMERFVERFKGGGSTMTAGAASNSGPVLAYLTDSQTPPGLAYSYDSDWIGWLGGCEGMLHSGITNHGSMRLVYCLCCCFASSQISDTITSWWLRPSAQRTNRSHQAWMRGACRFPHSRHGRPAAAPVTAARYA